MQMADKWLINGEQNAAGLSRDLAGKASANGQILTTRN